MDNFGAATQTPSCLLSRQRASPMMSSSCRSSSTTLLMLGVSLRTSTLWVYGLYRTVKGRLMVLANSLWIVHTAKLRNGCTSLASLCLHVSPLSSAKNKMEPNSPHLDFGLLEAVRHKVDILKGCDDAFLLGCNFGVEGHYPSVAGESMLPKRQRRLRLHASVCT